MEVEVWILEFQAFAMHRGQENLYLYWDSKGYIARNLEQKKDLEKVELVT
jgi:hypothetical protein